MTEAKTKQPSFEAKVAAHKEGLRESTIGAVIELANTVPGGAEFPSAPIDPALHVAARQLVAEAGLEAQAQAIQ